MPIHALLYDDYRSRQIIARIAVDLLEGADLHGQLPCVTATLAAIRFLTSNFLEDVIGELRKTQPELVRACVNFLVRPRLEEQHLAFAAAGREDCSCDLSQPLMRDLHQPINISAPILTHDGEPESAVVQILYNVLRCVHITLVRLRSDGTLKHFRRASALASRHKAARWPASPADITPYGAEDSIKALCTWTRHFPHERLLITINTYCLLVGYHAYPHLILSVVILGPFVSIVEDILVKWRTRREDRMNLEQCAKHLRGTRDVLSLFVTLDDDLLVLILRRDQRGFFSLFCTLLRALSVRSEMKTVNEGLRHEAAYASNDALLDDIWHAFAMPATLLQDRIWIPDYERSVQLELYRDTVREYRDRRFTQPLVALSFWFLHLYGGHLCSAPGCKHTYVSEGRRLHACAGCEHVFYCSRACQQHGWRHAEAPHREKCAEMGALLRLVDPALPTEAIAVEQGVLEAACVETLKGREDTAQAVIAHLRVLYRP